MSDESRKNDTGRRRMRPWMGLGLALVVLVSAGWLAGRSPAVPESDWLEVKKEDLVLSVPVTGSLEAVQSVRIGPPAVADTWEFKISFLAPEGVPVRPGMPVVGFDTSQLEQKLAEKEAERDSAQKELEKRQTNLENSRRDRELDLAEAEAKRRKAALKVEVPVELLAAHDLEAARSDLAVAEKEIAYLKRRNGLETASANTETGGLMRQRDRAAARVTEMKASIEGMSVKAPRAGTVVYVTDWEGNKKKVGDQAWRGQSVIEIPDLQRMRAVGEIDEADAGRVALGQRVQFHLDAHPDVTFTGHVRSIGTAVRGRSEQNPNRVVKLSIDLDRTDPQRMRPGMRLVGTVEIERLPGVVVAPAEAVFSRAEGALTYRRQGFGTQEVHPKVGRRNDRWVQILSELKPGDRISRRDLGAEAGAAGATGGEGSAKGGGT